ncbi:hypothetical protein BV22DRAFT_1121467 [Leucogyrophana mollusca]|uniref:Uncharacterized protein n=1 Tax=Leucogyrophana mollusca TaxID=85980 RepID=A0ACB8BB37_9AGAM|nr:hypothetical protein BV22DRAFT_1121467 [Leucogyrophana mollusca]
MCSISDPLCADVTAASAPSTVAQAQLKIDNELEVLGNRVRALRTRRNAISRISSLPDELLAAVFMHYASRLYAEYCRLQDSLYMPQPLQWIKVTHVCRHWRRVALSYPTLWSLLVPQRSRWCEEMLARSKMAALVIDTDLTYMTPKAVSGVEKALGHIGRVEELRLVSSKETMEKLLAPLVTTPAPLLKALSLENTRHTHMRIDNYSLSETLFGGRAPHLRKLELFKCDLVWSSRILDGLTHLDISHLTSSARPTMVQLIAALRRAPALKALSFDDALPLLPVTTTSISTITQDSPVILPVLASLRLVGTVVECAYLLAHLTIPINASLSLNCEAPFALGHDFSSLFPYISRLGGDSNGLSSSSGSAPFRSLTLRGGPHNESSSIFIQCSSSMQPPLTDYLSATPIPDADLWNNGSQLSLGLSWEGGDSTPEVISSVCGALPLSNLRKVHIYGPFELPERVWLDGFRGASELQELSLRSTSIGGLVEVLSLDAPQAPADTVVFAPTLTTITLSDIALDKADAPAIWRFRRVDPRDLRDALVVRANQGISIQKLVIKQCRNITNDDARLLEEVVADLNWDTVELYDGDSEDEESEDEDDYSDIYDYHNGGFLLGYGNPYGLADDMDFL